MCCMIFKMASNTKPSIVLRHHHARLCEILDTSDITLRSLTGNLFSEEIISQMAKNDILRKRGYAGADSLMSQLGLKVDQKPERLEKILRVMEMEESLQETVKKMRQGL